MDDEFAADSYSRPKRPAAAIRPTYAMLRDSYSKHLAMSLSRSLMVPKMPKRKPEFSSVQATADALFELAVEAAKRIELWELTTVSGGRFQVMPRLWTLYRE